MNEEIKAPVRSNFKTLGQYNAALRSYKLSLHKHQLNNNPDQLKNESKEQYKNRSDYFNFKIRSEENKHPISKMYLEMKDSQNSDPNPVTKTLRSVFTSPVHLAYGIYNKIDPHNNNKLKSNTVKINDNIDLLNSALDAASLANPFDYGMKANALWKQAASRSVKETVEDGAFDQVKKVNEYANNQFYDGGRIDNNINIKYNNYLNNNMRQFSQGGNLTRFDEGGTHESNPNGGVPQGTAPDGSQNLVEQGETKNGNFVYSNRIALDKDLIKQFNLPLYVANKSVADASKIIDKKFEDRQDKYAQETRKTLLDRLSQAQEHLKAQEQSQQDTINQSIQANSQQVPDMMNGEVPEGMDEFIQSPEGMPQEGSTEGEMLNPSSPIAAFGGYQTKRYNNGGYIQGDNNLDGIVNELDSTTPTSGTGVPMSGIMGGLSTGLDLGKTAFGKPAQDTSGLQASGRVSAAGMIGGSALKGAAAGSAIMPGIGTAIGALAGGLAGGAGLLKSRKAEQLNTINFAANTNRMLSDNYAAYGGKLFTNGGTIDPPVTQPINPSQLTPNIQSLTGIGTAPTNNNMNFDTKQIVRYQPGVVSGETGKKGFYLYSKNAGEPGFDPNRHREFINQEEMMAVQRTPQWIQYMKNQALINAAKPAVPQRQFVNGGPITGYGADGKWIKPMVGEADYSTNIIKNLQDALGIDPKTPGYGKNWGKKSNEAYFKKDLLDGNESAINWNKEGIKSYGFSNENVTGPGYEKMRTQLGLTPEGYKFTPETPILPQRQESEIVPTQTRAGFEAYANTVDQAKKNATPLTAKQMLDKGLKYAGENAGEALRYAPIAMNAFQLNKLQKPQGVSYNTLANRYKPNYVDEAQLQRIVDQEANNQIGAISQMGVSQGAARNAILGAGLNKTKALSEAYASAANQNRGIDAQAQTFNRDTDLQNINIRNRAIDELRADEGNYRTMKSKLLSTIGTDVGSVGKELADAQLAAALTGYTRKGKYLVKPDGTRVTPEELSKITNIYQSQTNAPVLKKGDKYTDENGVIKTFKYGGYLNTKKR